MPDYPPAIYRLAAEAVERELMSGTGYDMHADSDEAIARAVLDAVAADLGNVVAGKILAHMEARQPLVATGRQADPLSPWRRHLRAAARVAARAFLTGDDLKAIAARELGAGNFAACPAPEDTDG